MQPPIVKYQAKKETQVTKNKFCRIYSDIEENVDNWNNIPWFFHENVLFRNSWFFHPGFPGQWKPWRLELVPLIKSAHFYWHSDGKCDSNSLSVHIYLQILMFRHTFLSKGLLSRCIHLSLNAIIKSLCKFQAQVGIWACIAEILVTVSQCPFPANTIN